MTMALSFGHRNLVLSCPVKWDASDSLIQRVATGLRFGLV